MVVETHVPFALVVYLNSVLTVNDSVETYEIWMTSFESIAIEVDRSWPGHGETEFFFNEWSAVVTHVPLASVAYINSAELRFTYEMWTLPEESTAIDGSVVLLLSMVLITQVPDLSVAYFTLPASES